MLAKNQTVPLSTGKNMKGDKKSFSIAEDIRYRRVLDEAVVVRQNSNEVIVINEISASILDYLTQHEKADIVSLIHYLYNEYEVEPNVLEKDIPAHIEELHAAGILTSDG